MYTVNQTYQAPAGILEQLKNLFSVLSKGKARYESLAESIQDKDLQRTVIWLAQENNQYACELSCQIETMGGHVEVRDRELEKVVYNEQQVSVAEQTDNYVFDFCRLSEKEVIKAYRNVLNEPYLTSGIKDMVRYQLNGMLCAFQQLRLLNASLHR